MGGASVLIQLSEHLSICAAMIETYSKRDHSVGRIEKIGAGISELSVITLQSENVILTLKHLCSAAKTC